MTGAACSTAPAKLNELWKALHDALQNPGGCDAESYRHCEVLQAEIARLAINCPNSPEVLMANAVLAFRGHQLARSQQLLDQLLSLQADYPEAASLRARIALQDGNLRFALRFLEEQLQRFAEDPGLHETFAFAFYLAKRWDEAAAQLQLAARLGAPAWRVAYGMGLVEESRGRYAEAKAGYEEAEKARPGWPQPAGRLRALAAAGKIS